MTSLRQLSTGRSRVGSTGWREGFHGAGHKLCADGFFEALKPFLGLVEQKLPKCETANQRCGGGKETTVMEECFWESLTVIRAALEKNRPMVDALCGKIVDARNRLNDRHRKPRTTLPPLRPSSIWQPRPRG